MCVCVYRVVHYTYVYGTLGYSLMTICQKRTCELSPGVCVCLSVSTCVCLHVCACMCVYVYMFSSSIYIDSTLGNSPLTICQ